MNIASVPTNIANAVTPLNPVSKQAVGEESTDTKNSSLKAIVELSESAKTENRGDKKASNPEKPIEGKTQTQGGNSQEESQDISAKQRQERQQLLTDQEQIRELATRDREVRNHERAHAAVGGKYAGAPVYQYERGPDGNSYAVSGEVSISSGAVSGDPLATINKAQQVKRAALAPADPSPQDRRVAAGATQLEFEARQELLEIQSEKLSEKKEENKVNDEGESAQAKEPFLGSKPNLDDQRDRGVNQDDAVNSKINEQINKSNRRLIDIGIQSEPVPTGSIIKANV